MIASIVLVYGFIIWLVFDKLKLLRLSLPIALALAAVGPLFVFYLLLSMNNYHPSSSDARVFQRIVQITPHITPPGRVQEVAALPNVPLKKGAILFTIDPRSFQYEVSRLEAALAAVEQGVPQLKSSLDQASASVEKAQAQVALTKSDFERQSELAAKGIAAQATLERASRNLQTAEQGLAEARAAEERARLAYQSNIGSENTAVAQARQQLAQARYNLDETVVRAPCDGYVTDLNLLPGAIVSAAASVMPYVCDRDERNAGVVVASFMQGPYLQITPGDYAEVVFPMYPGRVFPGKVLTTIDVAGQGQRVASGVMTDVSDPGTARFAVRIRLDDSAAIRLPAGMQGSAAVFTGNVQIAGVMRMALMRITSWTNYLFFTA